MFDIKVGVGVKSVIDSLEYNPIIAALPHIDRLSDVICSSVEVVFLLSGRIIEIADRVSLLKEKGKKVFIHVDLIEGLGKDPAAIDYVSQIVRPYGIISTRNNLLKCGKEGGLVTIQRLFLIDSLSYESGIRMIESHRPDFVEVMPGIIPKAIQELNTKISRPIIAGGMITHKMDIFAALKAGALAVSTSKKELWSAE